MGYGPWGHKESDTSEATKHTHRQSYFTLKQADGLYSLVYGLHQMLSNLYFLTAGKKSWGLGRRDRKRMSAGHHRCLS